MGLMCVVHMFNQMNKCKPVTVKTSEPWHLVQDDRISVFVGAVCDLDCVDGTFIIHSTVHATVVQCSSEECEGVNAPLLTVDGGLAAVLLWVNFDFL